MLLIVPPDGPVVKSTLPRKKLSTIGNTLIDSIQRLLMSQLSLLSSNETLSFYL